jgi:hypothetical protein
VSIEEDDEEEKSGASNHFADELYGKVVPSIKSSL